MTPKEFWDKELEDLEQERAKGTISEQDFKKAYRDLIRDCQAAREEAALEAYERELENW